MVARDKEDLTGHQIGNYEIESHLAARRASDLFLARDVKLERLVFLEVLRFTSDEAPDLAERFQNRMETVSHLKEPHIGVVSDIDETEDGFPYAVIEYFPYTTLAQRLDDLPVGDQLEPVIETLEFTKEMARGLSVGHAAGLIHHDLRPSNILLREDGMPVFIDLGVPVVVDQGQAVLGKSDGEMLDYASPEELEGKSVTRRSNIYSLGVILYEQLAGHRPRLPNLPFDIFPQANMPKEEPLEDARPGLAGETYRLVRNCLWRQEWSRFETADEMITAIETAIFAEQDLPKSAGAPGRSRALVFAIPVVLLLLAAVAFFALRGNLGADDIEPTPRAEVVDGSGNGQTGIGGVVDEPTAFPTASATATVPLPTESATEFSISMLAPVPNRQFTQSDTINFDWFWPTLPEDGHHFAVYLIDGSDEYQLGSLTEPNNGAVYRLAAAVADLPVFAESLLWQVRLERIADRRTSVASDRVPLIILMEESTATPTPTVAATASPTTTSTPTATATSTIVPALCVVSPPPGWVIYRIQEGDSIAGLAARANVPVDVIIRVNCLRSILLSVGQELWVPPASAPVVPTSPPVAPTSVAPPPTSPPSPSTPAPVPATNTPVPPTVETPPTERPSVTAPPPPTQPPPPEP